MKTVKKGNGLLMSQVIFCPNDNGSNSHEKPSFEQLSDNEFKCKNCETVLVVKNSDVNLDRNWRLRIEVYVEEKKSKAGSLESAWVIEYEDGSKEIMTEQVFGEHSIGMIKMRKKVISESHYFDIQKAIERNPEAPVSW